MKIYQFVILLLTVAFIGACQIVDLNRLQTPAPASPSLGIASDQINYKTATNSVVSCPPTTSTLVSDKDPARTSFISVDSSANVISLCKAATCVAGTGITLNANGGAFEQDDGYIGAYSCIGTTSTSTLSTVISD